MNKKPQLSRRTRAILKSHAAVMQTLDLVSPKIRARYLAHALAVKDPAVG